MSILAPGRGATAAGLVALALVSVGCRGGDEREGSASSSAPASKSAAATPTVETPPTPEPRPPREGPPVRKDGTIFGESELMGTHVSINLWLDPEREAADAGDAMEAALAEMAHIEELMSEWKPGSELSALNRAAGGPPMPISPELAEVLARSKQIAEATHGTFDPTFHGVGQLWHFTPGSKPPSPEAIREKLPLVDWRAIDVDRQAGTARLEKAGMMIGLGAIAKGYAVDRASKVLRERGFANHVVEAGGDTYASGTKGGRPWMVGVQNPEGRGALGVLPTSNRAVVTSGDYQRYFEYQGKRYAHILDPKTGWPIEQARSPKSVTLLARDATDADAYCTAVTVMGAEAGLAFVESHPELDAVIIERDDTVRVSSGLADVYVATPSE